MTTWYSCVNIFCVVSVFGEASFSAHPIDVQDINWDA